MASLGPESTSFKACTTGQHVGKGRCGGILYGHLAFESVCAVTDSLRTSCWMEDEDGAEYHLVEDGHGGTGCCSVADGEDRCHEV